MSRRSEYEGCYTKAQWDWLCEKYMKEGYSISDISRFVQLHRNSIFYHLKKRGITRRPPLEMFREEFNALGEEKKI